MEDNKGFYKELLGYIILLIVIILIKVFIVSPIRVNGTSMYPTLHDKDFMLLNKINYKFNDIKRFDIVVIKYDGEDLIKRVIGLPGEKIEYRDNKLYVNGKLIKENFTREEMEDYNINQLGSEVVPNDYYFVLGDNRPVSKDSRIIGFVSRDDIVGKSSTTLFPLNRFGRKK